MATVLSTQERSATGRLARKVGGYGEMLRLERELKKAGTAARVVRDPDNGRYRVVTVGE